MSTPSSCCKAIVPRALELIEVPLSFFVLNLTCVSVITVKNLIEGWAKRSVPALVTTYPKTSDRIMESSVLSMKAACSAESICLPSASLWACSNSGSKRFA